MFKKLFSPIWRTIYLLKEEKGRFFGILLLDFISLFPDLFLIARLRSYALFVLGSKIKKPGTSIFRKNFIIEYPKNLTIGECCNISRDVYFCGNSNIIIGDNVRIAYGVRIINIYHQKDANSLADLAKEIIIKDNVHIYANALILPGTILEEGVQVSAGSVISGQTTPYGVYLGNPARLVKKADI